MEEVPLKYSTIVNIVILTISLCSTFFYSANAVHSKLNNGWTDITVEEAWFFLNDTSNGIQIPIDVRFDFEWIVEHIDTPSPENPRNHCVCEWSNESVLQEFISLYNGDEIILYCLGGTRSVTAAEKLIENNFSGTIYNMLGGITAWKEAGYPTKSNQPPEKPVITGNKNGKTGTNYSYFISTTDPENDDVFYYVNWSDGSDTLYVGPYKSGDVIVLNHTWMEDGKYAVRVKAFDKYQAESNWTDFEVNMPKSIQLNPFRQLLEQLFERFPILKCLFYF